jgi:hypothetical protein
MKSRFRSDLRDKRRSVVPESHFAGLLIRAIRARFNRDRMRHVTGDIRYVALVHVPSFRGRVPLGVELVIPRPVIVLKVVASIFPAVNAVRSRIEVALVQHAMARWTAGVSNIRDYKFVNKNHGMGLLKMRKE